MTNVLTLTPVVYVMFDAELAMTCQVSVPHWFLSFCEFCLKSREGGHFIVFGAI